MEQLEETTWHYFENVLDHRVLELFPVPRYTKDKLVIVEPRFHFKSDQL